MESGTRKPEEFGRPDAVRPEEGDVIGPAEVVGGDWVHDDYGGHACVYLRLDPGARRVRIRTNDGEFAHVERDVVALHAFHQVLGSQLKEARLEAGVRISVLYRGQVQGAERSYHSYVVKREDGDGGLNLATLRPSSEPPEFDLIEARKRFQDQDPSPAVAGLPSGDPQRPLDTRVVDADVVGGAGGGIADDADDVPF